MTKFFVGLNFSNNGLLSRKIMGFRKRFDPKYTHYSFAHMSLLAPFDVDERDIADLAETLKEEIETFYYGKLQTPKLEFTGVGVYEYKRRNLIYLNPHYGTELQFCSDMIVDICMSHLSRSSRYKENKKQFLPLGVFNNEQDLFSVLEHARLEFNHQSSLPVESISLYENKLGIWVEKEVLVRFEENQAHLLHLKAMAL
ncbi:MAG: hypothetical protein HON90_15810 [Halobacteriovoraceae bacterium]|jgi:hypothetical protein|nr:hypothetical protein [Halobacteriovoraceae bacterium]